QGKGAKQMVEMANARCQHVHVAIPCFIHCLDIFYKVHAILAVIIESARKRGHIYRLFESFRCRIYGGGLLLRKTERYIDTHSVAPCHLRCSQPLMGTRI